MNIQTDCDNWFKKASTRITTSSLEHRRYFELFVLQIDMATKEHTWEDHIRNYVVFQKRKKVSPPPPPSSPAPSPPPKKINLYLTVILQKTNVNILAVFCFDWFYGVQTLFWRICYQRYFVRKGIPMRKAGTQIFSASYGKIVRHTGGLCLNGANSLREGKYEFKPSLKLTMLRCWLPLVELLVE